VLITPTARAPRRLFAIVASALALAIGFSGLAATTTLDSAAAAGTNPLAPLNKFTVLVQNNATVGNSGEFEGSLAVGGNLIFQQYNLSANKDGSSLPTADGLNNVQLFVGGTVQFPGNGKFDVNAGLARITTTAGMTVSADNRLYKTSQDAYVKTQSNAQTTVAGNGAASYTATAGAFTSAFPASTFTTLASTSTSYAALTASSTVAMVTADSASPERTITLTSGKVNVWNVNASALAGLTAVNFAGGVKPSSSTPLVINVTDDAAGTVKSVRLNINDVTLSKYILWNFKDWSSLTVTSNGSFNGSILAPKADLTYSNNSEFNGQIAAKSFTITTGAEIHHYGFTYEEPEKTTVAGSWSTTTECATPSNQLVVDAVTGVTYTWTAGGTGDFTAFSKTGLTGTYSFTASVTDASKYTLGSNPSSFSVTFKDPKDCNPPSTKCITPDLVKYTYTAATNSGTVTVTNPAGYNGVLCKPFWVTAVAWKYTTTEVWPQALDIENPMSNNEGGTKITKAGTYTYGAPVACGQGDIYASYVSQKQTSPTLSGVSQLNGPQTPFPEYFLHGMGFNGPTPTYTQSPAGCNKATPVAPTATPIKECNTYGSLVVGTGGAAVTLTATSPTATIAGVVYTLTSGNGTFGKWEVTATPATNRYFDGPQKAVYSGDLKARTVCVESVEPTIEVATCDKTTGTINSAYIVIPSTTGLIYSVDGTAYEAKDVVKLGTGAHTVTVEAKSGYTNTGEKEFTLDVKAYADACTAPTPVTGEAEAAPQVCDTDYVVQQGSVLAIAHTGVRYELWNEAQNELVATLTADTARPTANGTYYVKVIAIDSSYKVLPADEWIKVTVTPFTGTCVQTPVTGEAEAAPQVCDTDYVVQQGSVLAIAHTGVRYELWNEAQNELVATLTADTARPTANGTYYVKVIAIDTSYKVLPADEWIKVTVDPYTGTCAPTDVSGSAQTEGETCSESDYTSTTPADYTVGLGSVTANSAKGVTYELWNEAQDTFITVLDADTAYDTAGGTYYVRVIAASKDFAVSPANEWIKVVVPTNAVVCEVIGDPTQFQQCVVNALDPLTSDWTSNLTIVAADHVTYRVYFSDGTTWVDQGIWAAGTYDAGNAKLPYDTLVKVVAVADTSWSLLAPKSWDFTVEEAFDCNLPTGGIVTPKVVFAQTCEAGASYKLSITGGVQGTVLWSVNGGPQTTKLGTYTASAPSKLTIVATPAPGSGFDGDGLPRTFEKTFTDPAACDLETLAFTGQNVTPYLVIAVILFQVGLALVAVQFIRARRRARHLTAD
jgi:choice-of-anchor A domain-containing protein